MHGLLAVAEVEAVTVRMVGAGIKADSPVRRATSPVMRYPSSASEGEGGGGPGFVWLSFFFLKYFPVPTAATVASLAVLRPSGLLFQPAQRDALVRLGPPPCSGPRA